MSQCHIAIRVSVEEVCGRRQSHVGLPAQASEGSSTPIQRHKEGKNTAEVTASSVSEAVPAPVASTYKSLDCNERIYQEDYIKLLTGNPASGKYLQVPQNVITQRTLQVTRVPDLAAARSCSPARLVKPTSTLWMMLPQCHTRLQTQHDILRIRRAKCTPLNSAPRSQPQMTPGLPRSWISRSTCPRTPAG